MRRIGDHAFEGTQHLGRMVARLVCRDWMRLFDIHSKASIEELFAEVAKSKPEGLRRFAKGFLHRSGEYYYNVAKASTSSDCSTMAKNAFDASMRQTWISLVTDNDAKSANLFSRDHLYMNSMVVPNDRIYVVGQRGRGKTTLIKALCRRLTATNMEWGMPSIYEYQALGYIREIRTSSELTQTYHCINNDDTKPKGNFYLLMAYEEVWTPAYKSNRKRLKALTGRGRFDEIDKLLLNPPPYERGCYHWLFVSLLNNIQVWLSLRLTDEEKQAFGVKDHVDLDDEENQEVMFDSETFE